MKRFVLLALGVAMLLVGALDLTSRWVLGQDLIAAARAGVLRPAHVPAASAVARVAEEPLITTVESPRYTIVAFAPASCARGVACDVTLKIEPSPGLHLVPYGPYAFLPTPNAGLSYDAPPGKIMARERSPLRAVVTVPHLLVAVTDAPSVLEGRIRVITCDAETCKSEIQPISIALPPRLPSG